MKTVIAAKIVELTVKQTDIIQNMLNLDRAVAEYDTLIVGANQELAAICIQLVALRRAKDISICTEQLMEELPSIDVLKSIFFAQTENVAGQFKTLFGKAAECFRKAAEPEIVDLDEKT